MRYVAIIDVNNFFVSCERLFRPDLNTKPVVVLSSNDGCVVARSKEIKDQGIPMGVPFFQVKDTLKQIKAVCFSTNFALYRDLSRRLFKVVRSYCDEIEQYSIDEAFFAFSAETPAGALAFVTSLKERVETAVGLPVSIGVSDTKTRAKLVNAHAKRRDGLALFVGADFLEQFAETSIGEVWGVGQQSTGRYKQAGLDTVGSIVAAGREQLNSLTHKAGLVLQAELAGHAVFHSDRTEHLPQSIMSTRSFPDRVTDLSVLKDALAHHVRKVFEELRAKDLLANQLTVILGTPRNGDWIMRGGSNRDIFTIPTADTKVGLHLALQLLQKLYESSVPYKKIGIVVTDLCPAEYLSASLFANPTDQAAMTNLDQIIDTVNHRFGQETLKIGTFAKVATWQPRSDLRSPAYTTKWSQLKVVQA